MPLPEIMRMSLSVQIQKEQLKEITESLAQHDPDAILGAPAPIWDPTLHPGPQPKELIDK